MLPPFANGDDDTKFSQDYVELENEAHSPLKPFRKPAGSLNSFHGAIRAPSPDPSQNSMDDSRSDCTLVEDRPLHGPYPPTPPPAVKSRIQAFWISNKGLALVLISQLFGSLMNVATRALEMEGNDGQGYHPFHILFARMFITVVCASLYMWKMKIAHFPWGMPEVRSLLIARGLTGFFGVFGMYYSLLYLPLADATVITFLAPSLSCWACSLLIGEKFSRIEQIAAYISLFGVVLIARPVSLFASFSHSVPLASGDGDFIPSNTTITSPERLAADYDDVTPTQRATAVGIAMLGVLGSAGAFTTLRWIGKRAHPLISVNYFAIWCTIVSMVAMVAMPGVGFLLPKYFKDWIYLTFLGICGFVMQFLLAAGLQYEKSSRATNMLYMQMLFALALDKLVWGTTPGVLSIIGSSLILGSAIYVAMHKENPKKAHDVQERGDGDEELGLMSSDVNERRRSDDEAAIPMRALSI